MNLRKIADLVAPFFDVLLLPLVLPAGFILKATRRIGLQRLPWCRRMLLSIGVLPIRWHYYEPFIKPRDLRHALDRERDLPGIDWNLDEQLTFLSSLTFEDELRQIGSPLAGERRLDFNNGSFNSGDAEYLYQIIRQKKPARVVEIGSGQSTLIARAAIQRNREEVPGYDCAHTCVEPYECSWLEGLGINVIRKRMEDVDSTLYTNLGRDDLLFIDSSHVIRPQGDVVTEYLEILPRLKSGVIVHVHDVFSPRDYPAEWVFGKLMLWNEQYLLEAFLTNNRDWKVLGALNLLRHHKFEALHRVCPYMTPDCEPGSMYIQRR